MQIFSLIDDHAILCDTPRCFAEVQRLAAHTPITATSSSRAEVVLCVLEGELRVGVEQADAPFVLGPLAGLQIPAGRSWRGQAGAAGVKVLRVDSFHPHFNPTQGLMPALAQPHCFIVADGQMLVYTDYMRGGVLNFPSGFAAEKHFHQDADELFWFFQGQCRVETPAGVALAPAGTIVYTAPGEWHIIENAGPDPLLMFLTVTPNIVPSHTFFDAQGNPVVHSWEPLRGR